MALSLQETLAQLASVGHMLKRGMALSPLHIISFYITLVSTSSLWFLQPYCEARRRYFPRSLWSLVWDSSPEDVLSLGVAWPFYQHFYRTATQGNSCRSLSVLIISFYQLSYSPLHLPTSSFPLSIYFFLYSPKSVSCMDFYHKYQNSVKNWKWPMIREWIGKWWYMYSV